LNFDLCFWAILLKILLSLFFRELEECLLLNLILNVASAVAGITLSAVLFILIFVTSKFVGWKSLVPLSNLISFNSFKNINNYSRRIICSWRICNVTLEADYSQCPSQTLPLRPILIISPNLFGLVGSPTKTKNLFLLFFFLNILQLFWYHLLLSPLLISSN